MGYEVDFLPVGEGERGGDAIAVRFGNLFGQRIEQFVMVIDGGTIDSGERLVEHIREYYDTNTVDLVVNTHPDADHLSGLSVVLEKMEVERLWMHKPWEHAGEIRELFRDGRITDRGLRHSLRDALDNAAELERIARRKNISIDEPFSDNSMGLEQFGLRVLGPSKQFYEALVPHFRDTPQAEQTSLFNRPRGRASDAISWIRESWGHETLSDPEIDASSAENNSSVVLLLERDGRSLLFTGDAGVLALTEAAGCAEINGISLPSLSFVQIPHHGSRHNVGPTILDRILGPKSREPSNVRHAYVSAPERGDPKHPSRRVCNAFQRRGAYDQVFATQGQRLRHIHAAPPRAGYGPIPPLPFHERVEE